MIKLLNIFKNTSVKIVLLIIVSCSSITGPTEYPDENLIAFTAIFYTDADYTGRIVITDYEAPKNFKIVTPPGLKAIEPVFSYSKEKILFGLDGVSEQGYQFAVYDFGTNEMEMLYANNINDSPPLVGTNPIWDINNEGFYFTQHHTYSVARGIYYYNLTTKEMTALYNPPDASIYVIGLKSLDTLIVFSNQFYLTSQDSNFYFFMSKSGEYISPIKNQKLGRYINWNYKNKKFVFAKTSDSNYEITVADIEGTFNKQYTSSHYDTRPVWGPDNTLIFFNRRTGDSEIEQLFFIDTNTGLIRQFIEPNIINDADQIIDAAY